MLFRSREQQALDHIRKEIESRLAKADTPQEIGDFLVNRWSYLLAGIYLNNGDHHPDWEAGWQTVNALIWSLVPKQGRQETEQFLRLLPTLLERLQDGCEAMHLEAAERDSLFSQLAMMHAAVARAGLQPQLDEEGPISLLGPDADMSMSNEEMASLTAHAPEIEAPVDGKNQTAMTELGQIKLGDGIVLNVNGEEKILYLQWVSAMGGMYLFSDPGGFDAVSLTKSRLASRLRNGEVKRLQG